MSGVLVARILLAVISIFLEVSALGGGAVEEPERFVEVFGSKFEFELGEVRGPRHEVTCEKFDLDASDVELFFRNARLIDGYSMDKGYPWFPCALEGTMSTPEGRFVWEISPAGTSNIHPEHEDSESIYLVCDEECAKIFPDGGYMFDEP